MAENLPTSTVTQLVGLSYNSANQQLTATGNLLVAVVILACLILAVWVLRQLPRRRGPAWVADQAEFGIGNGKIIFKPSIVDQQVAYAIWVELSTRKIGLEIDLDDDVVAEVYDSWYAFFTITRDLLKTVPVARVKDTSTRQIINLSIDVLNVGLRPHLTKWQARFRGWYEHEIGQQQNLGKSPQEIQTQFPKWAELRDELLAVNKRLITYRKRIYEVF